MPWLGSSPPHHNNQKKKKNFFTAFWWGLSPPPPPPMGILGGVQRYNNFSTLVDGDDFCLEYILEHPLNRSPSHNLHLRKQILMKREKKTSLKGKK
jgi:hypothetical protein